MQGFLLALQELQHTLVKLNDWEFYIALQLKRSSHLCRPLNRESLAQLARASPNELQARASILIGKLGISTQSDIP